MVRHSLAAAIIIFITVGGPGCKSLTTFGNMRGKQVARAGLTCNHALYWRQFQSSPDTAKVLNVMCNSTSEDSKMSSDACYGCFSRALYSGQDTTFVDITSCVSSYMTGTVYQPCVDEFLNASMVVENSSAKCSLETISFCNFEKCVRRIDRNKLIETCIEEVQQLAGDEKEVDPVKMYINTTACILTKITCRPSLQENSQFRAWNEKYFGLFVTGQYDLRVIQMPHGSTSLACGFGTTSDKPVNWRDEKC